MTRSEPFAPGWPGIPARWTSSAKSGVGTALGRNSRVWFALSHGILNEVYYPRVDQACTRDMGCIVTDDQGFFSEEKRHAAHDVRYLAPGVPAYALHNRCLQRRYRITKEVLTDPERDVLLQRLRFVPEVGALESYHLYVLLAPHLGNQGAGNSGWCGEFKGVPMLFARRDRTALALACSVPWLARTAGFVGFSDGWRELHAHGRLSVCYERAENGNIALTGEVDLAASGGNVLLALGFGRTPSEAAHRALASLNDGWEAARTDYIRQWQGWHATLPELSAVEKHAGDPTRVSATVLRVHEAKRFPGGIIASLSIPWGDARGDHDLGGYHLVWPRDQVEAAGGLLALGAADDVLRVLRYLQTTQEADGHWPQNMWLDGTSYWGGLQMDETAFPILLVELAYREGRLDAAELRRLWPMVRRATGFLLRNGPVTQQDRWEEDAGYSPFTLAVEVAALLAAAELAVLEGESEAARYLRETADAWNDSIESWCYVSGTELAERVGVAGYYVRIAPPEVAEGTSPASGWVPIKNRPPNASAAPTVQLVSPDALALVRFGLRAPDDPRVTDTVRVIDALLKVEGPEGSLWRRYNGDGYGEHADGAPFDGTGIGRAWPLLTGERAHYELAAGRRDEAERLLQTLERAANHGGMLPEQVWDAPDVPARELVFGSASGSAMPLVWAHAEYVKLRRSLRDGRVWDTPPQPVQRYQVARVTSPRVLWRFNQKRRTLPPGKQLRVETLDPATIHWSPDEWTTVHDTPTQPSGFGTHLAELPTAGLASGATVRFTFRWQETARWEGKDYAVRVE